MRNLLAKAMGALSGSWRQKVSGAPTDGARDMRGRHRGFATRLQAEACPGLHRAWRGAHQLNLAMQKAASMRRDESFLDRLASLIAHLRRQQNLTREMKTVRPRCADARWLSIGKALKWLVGSRIRARSRLEEKNPPCKPNSVW